MEYFWQRSSEIFPEDIKNSKSLLPAKSKYLLLYLTWILPLARLSAPRAKAVGDAG